MVKDSAGIIQAMPLLEGKVNLTLGSHKVNELIHCVEDGVITVVWPTGTSAILQMVAGDDYAFKGAITITSGKFHVS